MPNFTLAARIIKQLKCHIFTVHSCDANTNNCNVSDYLVILLTLAVVILLILTVLN